VSENRGLVTISNSKGCASGAPVMFPKIGFQLCRFDSERKSLFSVTKFQMALSAVSEQEMTRRIGVKSRKSETFVVDFDSAENNISAFFSRSRLRLCEKDVSSFLDLEKT
jgi:hypothetical protein